MAELLDVLQDGQSDGKVVAVGETGLDYDRWGVRCGACAWCNVLQPRAICLRVLQERQVSLGDGLPWCGPGACSPGIALLPLRAASRRLHFCDAETQRRYFARQFELARSSGLPMFLHLRAAAADFLDIVERHAGEASRVECQLHAACSAEAVERRRGQRIAAVLLACAAHLGSQLEVVSTCLAAGAFRRRLPGGSGSLV